jgi:hypothetical protein
VSSNLTALKRSQRRAEVPSVEATGVAESKFIPRLKAVGFLSPVLFCKAVELIMLHFQQFQEQDSYFALASRKKFGLNPKQYFQHRQKSV